MCDPDDKETALTKRTITGYLIADHMHVQIAGAQMVKLPVIENMGKYRKGGPVGEGSGNDYAY